MNKPKTPNLSDKFAGKRKVFLVDDHPIVRQGLAQLIDNENDLAVIGQGEDAYGSLRAIRDAKPDLALVDVSLKDSDGIELVKELKAQCPDMPILVLSMHDETLYAERALRAGASGYVMKHEPPQTLLNAIRTVLSGNVYTSPKMSAALLQRMVGGKKSSNASGGLPMDRLTDRELEVFRMIGAGKSVKEIADSLFLSVKTVEAHREHIKEKLNFRTSAELLRFAIRNSPDA
ncbi:MAG TPA: response regulator transcription factor [Tepidisphaeraceae bacterium]|nr:response regulator transcription factor [Tepidisphaeraceae bacterium]